MAKFRTKSTIVEAITFDELIEYGKSVVPEEEWNNGMPWSFDYKNHPISHETDRVYLITTVDNGILRMTPDEMLVTITHRGKSFLDNVPIEQFNEEYEIAPHQDTITGDRSGVPLSEMGPSIIQKLTGLINTIGLTENKVGLETLKEVVQELEQKVPKLGEGNSLGEKIVREIGTGEHGTMEDAIEKVLEEIGTGEGTVDYYFMVFDMNNDFTGTKFEKVEKKRISYSNEMELQGHIGQAIEKLSTTEDKMVMFMNKDRAIELMKKVALWEQIDHAGMPLKAYASEYWWLIEHGTIEKEQPLASGKGWIREIPKDHLVEDLEEELSTSSDDCLKFNTQEEAQDFIDEHELEGKFIATEHEFFN